MLHLILIAAGGMLGALARYGLSRLIQTSVRDIFPWGTMMVNLSGCLMIGAAFELFDRAVIPSDLRSLVTIGFLGAFTTFSTYSLETVNLLRDGQIKLCFLNVLVSNVIGIFLVVMGMQGIRAILRLKA